MCGRSQCCLEPVAETEREKLKRAIERLEKRKWCDDATLALDAARKHLATLPPDNRYRVNQTGLQITGSSDFPDRHKAEKHAAHLIACGANSVSIEHL